MKIQFEWVGDNMIPVLGQLMPFFLNSFLSTLPGLFN